MDVSRSAALRHFLTTLEPRPFAIGAAVAASIVTSILVGLAWAWQNDAARDRSVEDFGRTTARQLATFAIEPLLANDRIRLGVLVTQLAEMPAVRQASIVTVDERVVATAGTEATEDTRLFVEEIAFDGEVAGHVRIHVEVSSIGASALPGPAAWLMALLSALGAGLAAHFLWLARFEPTAGPPEVATDAPATEGGRPVEFLTVVNFFNQTRIPADRRADVLRAVRLRLERLAITTGSRLIELPGTGWVLASCEQSRDTDFGFPAICTALAAVESLDELNGAPGRLPGIELSFRVGMHTASPPFDSADALRQSDALQDALVLSAVAPTGCLAASADAFERLPRPERLVVDALVHPMLQSLTTSRRDGCVVVSTIADAYRGTLDRLLERIGQDATTSSPSTF
jgi:uncharacterized membrane protein affecting hemolysin expression